MGGFGSGGWNASGRPMTTESFCLGVNQLNKAGGLVAGWAGVWTWTRDGEQFGNAGVRATDDGIVLNYRCRIGDGDWTDHHEPIAVSWEPCRFGGRRPFFHCPGCTQRVLFVYARGRYLCRRCHGLTYPSQRERESDRAQRKANRLRGCLGGDPGWQNIPSRPKGMHRQRYERLVSEIIIADAVTDDAAARLLVRLRRTVQPKAQGFWT
ncbi:MAG: hypothetical protein P8M79_07955 [Alphaproteobacteria bacterium]|nr:hypothetical protein [Alphaproteobacteria bacterium]